VTTTSTTAAQPLVDLQRLVVAIRRKRRSWLFMGLLGLIAGGLITLFLPAPPTAVVKVIVIHQDDSPTDAGTLMRTDVAVLSTAQIADGALKALKIQEAPEEFLKNYAGLGLTNNVMQITVKGKSNEDAVARAKALADTFIADHNQRSQAAAAAQSKAILEEGKNAQAQLEQVNSQITDEQNKGKQTNASTLENLYGRRAALASQISDFENRAQQAGIGSPQVAAGTQIIDAPRVLPKSLLKTGATNGGIGFALGLALGLAVAAVTSVSRDRPVLRREISTHLGASVIAQLPSKRRGPARIWRRSRAVAERKRVATTLVRAIKTDVSAVSLLELGAPKVAAALSLDIAEQLAADGPAGIIDDLPRGDVRKLAAETEGSIGIHAAGDPEGEPGERRIGVGSVAPGTAWTDLEHLGAETVLVVKAGHANTLWLHTVARQLADCRIPIIGVVLVDPDPRDKSDGTLWDGLHTALRGRGGLVPAVTQVEEHHEDRVDEPVARIVADDQPTRMFAPVRPVTPMTPMTPRPPVTSTGPATPRPPVSSVSSVSQSQVPPVAPVPPVPVVPAVIPVTQVAPAAQAKPSNGAAPLPAPGTVSVPADDAPTKKFAPVKPKRPSPFKRDHAEPSHKGELPEKLDSEQKSAEVS
jgi:hypothetical protein